MYLRALTHVGLIAAWLIIVAVTIVVLDGEVVQLGAGALVGLVSGILDILSRRTIASQLRSAGNFGELMLAYQSSPWGRYKNLIVLALFVALCFLLPWPGSFMERVWPFFTLFGGFAIVDSTFRVILARKLKPSPVVAADVR